MRFEVKPGNLPFLIQRKLQIEQAPLEMSRKCDCRRRCSRTVKFLNISELLLKILKKGR